LAIPWGTGSALTGMAWGALASSDAAQAEQLLDEATSTLRDAGPWFLSLVSCLRAILAVRRGDPDEAIALVRESLTRIRDLQDRFAFVYALVPLAAAAALKGDDAWAGVAEGHRWACPEPGAWRRGVGGMTSICSQEADERERGNTAASAST
jgi:hypothetical protein